MVNKLISRLFKWCRSRGSVLLIAIAVVTLLSACVTVSITVNIHEPKPAAPREMDHFFSDGKKVPVTVALDKLGILAKDGVTPKEIKAFIHSFDGKILEEYRGGLFIVGLGKTIPRQDLTKLVRELAERGENLIAVVGKVVTLTLRETTTPMIVSDQFIVGFAPDIHNSNGAKTGASLSERMLVAKVTLNGQRVVASTLEKIEAFKKRNNVQIVMQNPFVKGQFLLKTTEASSFDGLQMANLFHESGLTKFAYPNFLNVFIDMGTTPNDTYLGDQWHHENTGQDTGQGQGTVDADADTSLVWEKITQGNAGTVIAVVESGGFDMTHPDLSPNIIGGWDFAACTEGAEPGCGDPDPTFNPPISGTESSDSHGTAVAGVAAAKGNKVTGSCPDCSLMLLKTKPVMYDFARSLAIGYAQVNGARIINNGWTPNPFAAVPNTISAIEAAVDAGVVVLFAAGNTNWNPCPDGTEVPAVSHPGVIAVGGSTNRDRKVVESAIGNCIDILAPTHRGYGLTAEYTGTLNITTTDLPEIDGQNNAFPDLVPNCPSTEADSMDYTHCFGGTSAAVALTAGVVGLMLTVNQNLTPLQVKRLLQDTADKIEPGVASYADDTGFSSPTSGVATHSWGRLNAFEAVRIAAKGNDGVDIFLRDNRLDWGNTEQPSNTLFEPIRGFIGHWQSMDIKVDAPQVDAPQYRTPPTAATFDTFTDETPSAARGDINRVYVRVRNRGPVAADTVTIKLYWTQLGTTLPDLPKDPDDPAKDFWAAFPTDSTDTSQWHPLTCAETPAAETGATTCTVQNLEYSGASVATTDSDAAQIVRFDFPGQPVDGGATLLGLIDSDQDRVLPKSRLTIDDDYIVDSLTPTDNNITLRNYHYLITDLGVDFTERFFVRNPTDEPMQAVLRLQAPHGWKAKPDRFAFNEPFELKPRQEELVTVRVALPQTGLKGEVTILQEQLGAKDAKVVGGITYRFAPSKPVKEVSSAGAARVYLVGTYDLRREGTTVLHVVNPTAKHLRLMFAFFDDSGKPLKCVRDKLSPNDLLEIDVRKAGVKAKLGVVKVVALHAAKDVPEVGVVVNQRIIRKGARMSETSLQPVQPGNVREHLKLIRKACQ